MTIVNNYENTELRCVINDNGHIAELKHKIETSQELHVHSSRQSVLVYIAGVLILYIIFSGNDNNTLDII